MGHAVPGGGVRRLFGTLLLGATALGVLTSDLRPRAPRDPRAAPARLARERILDPERVAAALARARDLYEQVVGEAPADPAPEVEFVGYDEVARAGPSRALPWMATPIGVLWDVERFREQGLRTAPDPARRRLALVPEAFVRFAPDLIDPVLVLTFVRDHAHLEQDRHGLRFQAEGRPGVGNARTRLLARGHAARVERLAAQAAGLGRALEAARNLAEGEALLDEAGERHFAAVAGSGLGQAAIERAVAFSRDAAAREAGSPLAGLGARLAAWGIDEVDPERRPAGVDLVAGVWGWVDAGPDPLRGVEAAAWLAARARWAEPNTHLLVVQCGTDAQALAWRDRILRRAASAPGLKDVFGAPIGLVQQAASDQAPLAVAGLPGAHVVRARISQGWGYPDDEGWLVAAPVGRWLVACAVPHAPTAQPTLAEALRPAGPAVPELVLAAVAAALGPAPDDAPAARAWATVLGTEGAADDGAARAARLLGGPDPSPPAQRVAALALLALAETADPPAPLPGLGPPGDPLARALLLAHPRGASADPTLAWRPQDPPLARGAAVVGARDAAALEGILDAEPDPRIRELILRRLVLEGGPAWAASPEATEARLVRPTTSLRLALLAAADRAAHPGHEALRSRPPPYLVARYDDADTRVRVAAWEATVRNLWRAPEEAIAAALIEPATSVHALLARASGWALTPPPRRVADAALAGLRTALEGDDADLIAGRNALIYYLDAEPEPDLLQDLVQHLDHAPVRQAWIPQLQKTRPRPALLQALRWLLANAIERAEVCEVFAAWGPDARAARPEVLAASSATDPLTRLAARRALARIDGVPLEVPALRDALASGEPWAQARALALAGAEPECLGELMDALVDLVRSAPEDAASRVIDIALEAHGRPGGVLWEAVSARVLGARPPPTHGREEAEEYEGFVESVLAEIRECRTPEAWDDALREWLASGPAHLAPPLRGHLGE